MLECDDKLDLAYLGQQLRLFNRHFNDHRSQPIVVFDGDDRFVAAVGVSAMFALFSGSPSAEPAKCWACQVLGQHYATRPLAPRGHDDEDCLVADMIELARQDGRYGYCRIAALLRDAGWSVSDKRVERLWRLPSAVC